MVSGPSRIVYASFDRVPAPKGAAVHIGAFARALAAAFGPLDLVTLPEPEPPRDPRVGEARLPEPSRREPPARPLRPLEPLPARELWPGVIHHPMPVHGPTVIARAMCFRTRLADWWGGRRPRVVHFRSIFEGYPIACRKGEVCEKIVYEVNGLPSIELKYHYPDVADDEPLLAKLTAQEDRCIAAADLLVTPSAVTAEHLIERGADPARVRVIPNGVDLEVFTHRPPRAWRDREVRMLYTGTLAAWQGVPAALEALALYRRDHPAHLQLVGTATRHQRRELGAASDRLSVTPFVERVLPVDQAELVRMMHNADVIVAPLLRNDRNEVQGCCPLKVLEAMAAGTPLIASDLRVVSELARPGQDALLVRPGSGKAIKDAMLRLRAPDIGARLSRNARERVETTFTWERAQRALVEAYEEVVLGP